MTNPFSDETRLLEQCEQLRQEARRQIEELKTILTQTRDAIKQSRALLKRIDHLVDDAEKEEPGKPVKIQTKLTTGKEFHGKDSKCIR